jgi:hypothetical protein
MHRFFKAFWYISIILFLATLFYFYAGLAERDTFSGNSLIIKEFSKDELFYMAIGAFLISNIICFALTKALAMSLSQSPMTTAFIGGTYGFAASVNFFYCSTLLVLLFFERQANNLYYLVYVGPVFFLLWLIGFVSSIIGARLQAGNE